MCCLQDSTANLVARNSTAFDSALGQHVKHNNYPTIPWMTESWLSKLVPYERLATASPRIGMGIIGVGLIQHHVNLMPTLHSAADFVYVHDHHGRSQGVRPKMATWPLSKKEVLAQKQWAA